MRRPDCITVWPNRMVFITVALGGRGHPTVGHAKRKMAVENASKVRRNKDRVRNITGDAAAERNGEGGGARGTKVTQACTLLSRGLRNGKHDEESN